MFQLINEAREFILHVSKNEEKHDAHVFAPVRIQFFTIFEFS